jgi:hypothetical protein
VIIPYTRTMYFGQVPLPLPHLFNTVLSGFSYAVVYFNSLPHSVSFPFPFSLLLGPLSPHNIHVPSFFHRKSFFAIVSFRQGLKFFAHGWLCTSILLPMPPIAGLPAVSHHTQLLVEMRLSLTFCPAGLKLQFSYLHLDFKNITTI